MHGRGAKTLRLCKFTTNHNTQSSRFFNFLSTDAVHVRNMFFKSSKKVPKSWSKLESICHWYVHFDHFFSTSQKSGFQNLTAVRGLWSLHMPPAKSDYFPNTGRTDGTSVFDLPTNVKSASRNKSWCKARQENRWYFSSLEIPRSIPKWIWCKTFSVY